MVGKRGVMVLKSTKLLTVRYSPLWYPIMSRQLHGKFFRIPIQIGLIFVEEVTVFAECSLNLSGASLGEGDVHSSNEQVWTVASALVVIIEG